MLYGIIFHCLDYLELKGIEIVLDGINAILYLKYSLFPFPHIRELAFDQ